MIRPLLFVSLACFAAALTPAAAFQSLPGLPPGTPETPVIQRALPLDDEDVRPASPPAAHAAATPPEMPESQPVKRAVAVDDDDEDIPIAPEAPKVAANEKPSGEDALRLQIFLDEAHFGPGILDGKPGRFTELAVRAWNEANGHPADDWTAVTAAARKAVPHPLATAIVPDWANDWVNPKVPYKDRRGQAALKRMSYRSLGEMMAERYHCDRAYLVELNGAAKINALKLRDTILVPNVKAFQIEILSTGGGYYPPDEALAERLVVVDTRVNQLRVFEAAPAAVVVEEDEDAPATVAAPSKPVPNRALVASFPITPGKPQFIRLGIWEIRNMVELPVWRYDQQLLDTGKRSANALTIPPGPNSPVGVIWIGTSRPGIGLHGTSDPETIGRSRSAGCIRLANWDAVRLPDLIRPGATLEIR